MTSKIRNTVGWCFAAGLIASVALASAGRMKGIVGDSAGNPIGGVVITVRAVGYDFEKVVTSKKNGKFSLTVTEGGRPYTIRLEREGYQTVEEPFKFESGQVMDTAWVMFSNDEAAQQATQLQALEAKDKATKAYNAGADAYNSGDKEAAIGHFRAAVESNDEFDLAYAALARLFLETEQWGEALAAAESFLAIQPDDPVGLQMLYDSHWGAGDAVKADAVLEKLLAFGSGPAVAARIFNQAVAATKKMEYELAERGFTRALELDSSLHQALLPLAQIAFAREDWQAAIDKAEAYLGHDPGHPRANIVRYVSYQQLGETDKADMAFAEIKENSPSAAAELFLRDGTNLYNNGAVAEATEAVETSLALDPSNPNTYYQLGLCYASAGRNAEAKAKLEEFLERAPDHPEAGSVRDMLTYLK
ncbi:MAG: tetratricopeptide repeat protein [Thermoanaerobaculia bacterium]